MEFELLDLQMTSKGLVEENETVIHEYIVLDERLN